MLVQQLMLTVHVGMQMRISACGKLKWILTYGLLIEVLLPHHANAELFRRRRLFFRPNNFQVNGAAFRRPVFSNQGFDSSKNQSNGNFNNQNVKEVLGFSQLLQAGNNIIEKTSEGVIRRLQVRGNGELIAFDPRVGSFVRPEAETVRHLRQFYLKNLDKFNGNAKNIVNRFLVANGGISNGRFVVDLDTFDIPTKGFEKLPIEERRKAALASLNFLLNSLQTKFKLRIPPEKVINGKVELNLGGFFNQEALAIMAQSDPSSQCTGRIRINNLIAFTMDPDNYYRILGAPDNAKDLANILGVQLDKTKTVGNKLAILDHESGVSPGEQRIIEVQNTQNVAVNGQALSRCYRSLDTQDLAQSGVESESRSVAVSGINWTHEAEEWLCLGQNGFMQTYLFNNPDGKRLTEAPASIAHQGGNLGPAIRAGASCLDCHVGGFIAGGVKPTSKSGERYTDFFDKPGTFPSGPTVFRDSFGRQLGHKDFFTSNNNYRRGADVDSNIFVNAQKETGSFYRFPEGSEAATADGGNPEGGPRGNDVSVPLIPKAKKKHSEKVKAEQAAKELGVSVQAAERMVGKDGMSRTVFDNRFCNLQQGLNAGLNEFQSRDLLQRESRQPFIGGDFGFGASHLNR